MEDNNAKISAALGGWMAAFGIGTLAGTLLWVLGGWGFLQGAFVGFLVFLILGAIFTWVMTTTLPAPNTAVLPDVPAPGANAPSTNAAPVKAAPVKAPPAPTVAKVKPSKRLPGQEELAARKGTWKYENEDAPKPAPKPKKKTAPKKETVADDARPALMLDAPEGGIADDLKKISGVGPKLEETLNGLGVYHYAQVAKFSKADIAWVDERLRFKGRIERDDWIGQAKALAKGNG